MFVAINWAISQIKYVSDSWEILSEKRLCFNWTVTKRCTADYRSNRKCLLCKCKHHTSNWEKHSDETSEPILASTESSAIYSVAIIKANGMKCSALLDTGSGSSYASKIIINLLKINLIREEYNTIETLTNGTTKKLKIYLVKIQDLKNEFSFTTGLGKLYIEVLLTLPNPIYNEMINKYNHLDVIKMHNTDTHKKICCQFILCCEPVIP